MPIVDELIEELLQPAMGDLSGMLSVEWLLIPKIPIDVLDLTNLSITEPWHQHGNHFHQTILLHGGVDLFLPNLKR